MAKYNRIKTFAFDLDNTLCNSIRRFHQEDILKVKPRKKLVTLIRELHNEGNKILIFTSRDSCGDSAKYLTEQWLHRYNIPYDSIITTKPHYDLLIDDRALSSHMGFISKGFLYVWIEFIKKSITKHTYRGKK